MTILLAGATGLVGSRVLGVAARLARRVVPVGRRATGMAGEVVADFAALPKLPRAGTAICALGTTIRDAGGPDAFKAVDFDAVLAFSRAAQAAGVRHFLLVSAVGANPGSPLLYNRTKGEIETALATMGFDRLDILQPGLILGPRPKRRPVEAFLQWLAPTIDLFLPARFDHYGAVPATSIAAALIALAGQSAPGVYRHHNRDIVARALDLYVNVN
ncbi:hypothetical protein [Sandarakinorhabdus sp.]|uniref:hypothetical protein n=1 Tax=Sandarakinorhabdus sp. TaxID=1916663 RepID=UPI00286EAB45|nr:hypothetical protein [Sandarakinorhabdus sp.]